MKVEIAGAVVNLAKKTGILCVIADYVNIRDMERPISVYIQDGDLFVAEGCGAHRTHRIVLPSFRAYETVLEAFKSRDIDPLIGFDAWVEPGDEKDQRNRWVLRC